MKRPTKIDLSFLSRQVAQVLDEQRALREDFTVLAAMVRRVDATMQAMIEEIRAMHGQQARFDYRLRKIETTQP